MSGAAIFFFGRNKSANSPDSFSTYCSNFFANRSPVKRSVVVSYVLQDQQSKLWCASPLSPPEAGKATYIGGAPFTE